MASTDKYPNSVRQEHFQPANASQMEMMFKSSLLISWTYKISLIIMVPHERTKMFS